MLFSVPIWGVETKDDREFRYKLSQMYKRVNKSLEILREQITENQSAPFLANLYLQLGNLLTQKSNVLYYLKMESATEEELKDKSGKQFNDVVASTKEAIAIYQKILKEFPKFKGRAKTMYLLALSLKSIDESVEFMKVINALVTKYPGTKEAVKGQLLYGQHLFDMGALDEAIKKLMPLVKTSFPYERNMAKYKVGLIYLASQKHRQALNYFEQVALDESLKEENDEFEVSLKTKSVKSSLKREALIDSIRAYTEVFKKNADPVKYYSNIAPSENLFQEVIQKLSFRYIKVKRYNDAIKLLRVLSERTASAEQVINIYKEVLLMIPLDQRVYVPVKEIRYVMERYLRWLTFYRIEPRVKRSTIDFFEKQLRDLGTRSHEKGKRTKGKPQYYYLTKASEFYELYLAMFPRTDSSVKMAMNLGDSFFRLKDYLRCGDYYLRAFKGEFGKTRFKAANIKNSIYCLQKNREYGFYELRRIKGLLIEALNIYMRFDKSKQRDPKTNFILAKAFYDQGFYDISFGKLVQFMKRFPKSKYAVDSVNLILDYFNIKSDFKELVNWSNRILAFRLPNAEINNMLKKVREQAKMKKLEQQVETASGYDGLAQGKSYLQSAANIGNVELRNLALKKALDASKREKDIDTFFKSAKLLASKERDPKKKVEIQQLMAQENLKIGNFKEAQSAYNGMIRNGRLPRSMRQDAYDQAVGLSMALRDWRSLSQLARNRGFWARLNPDIKNQVKDQLNNLLESPVEKPAYLSSLIRSFPPDAALSLAVVKAQGNSRSISSSMSRSMSSRVCRNSPSRAVCKWRQLDGLDRKRQQLKRIFKTSKSVGKLEAAAQQFEQISGQYASLEGSEDAQLDVVVSLRQAELYSDFGQYLIGVGRKNPDLGQVLMAKGKESIRNGKNFYTRCKKIIQSAKLVSPVNRFCYQRKNPSKRNVFSWKDVRKLASVKTAAPSKFKGNKKEIFANYNGENLLELAFKFFNDGNYHYASALGAYGLSAGGNVASINTVLGCSVLNLGYLSEAKYYLANGSNFKGLKTRCMRQLKSYESQY